MERCKYELFIEKYFGLNADETTEKTEIKTDFGQLVNALAMFDEEREEANACTSEKDLRVCDVNASFYDPDDPDEDFGEEEPAYKECMCCGNIQQYGTSCNKCAGPTKDGFI